MYAASRISECLNRIAWIGLVLAVGAGGFLGYQGQNLPGPDSERPVASPATVPNRNPDFSTCDWTLFRGTGETSPGKASAKSGELAKRFRLAGTFFSYSETSAETRRAVIDELAKNTQHVVGEQDLLGSVTVIRILPDRVLLREGSQEEELVLTFSRASGMGAGSSAGTVGGGEGGLADRFGGKRVGENRWMFEREKLLNYYKELSDNPERLLQVFKSLYPVYGTDSKSITGYQLHVEGEKEFFDAVGLSEGDVVKAVNSVEMTNRRRAEHFIRDFVERGASAFVLDVDRKGSRQKLIYQVR